MRATLLTWNLERHARSAPDTEVLIVGARPSARRRLARSKRRIQGAH